MIPSILLSQIGNSLQLFQNTVVFFWIILNLRYAEILFL